MILEAAFWGTLVDMHNDNVTIVRGLQLSGAIYRFIYDLNCPRFSLKLFNAFVLPIIEYGLTIWDQFF